MKLVCTTSYVPICDERDGCHVIARCCDNALANTLQEARVKMEMEEKREIARLDIHLAKERVSSRPLSDEIRACRRLLEGQITEAYALKPCMLRDVQS